MSHIPARPYFQIGRTAVKARSLVDDALALQDAGAFAVVVECVPAPVAKVRWLVD